jgi:hypothetical protein
MNSDARSSNALLKSKGAANPRLSWWLFFRGGFLVVFFLVEGERSAGTLYALENQAHEQVVKLLT